MTLRRTSVPDRRRGISTVLDAAVFMLLVSAAIGLLYAGPQAGDDADPDPEVAAETATTLATSIETVEYAPAPNGDREDAGTERADRGTIAELLAETTVANARLDDEPLTRAPNHEAAVRNATLETFRRAGPAARVQVKTQWQPLTGTGVRGGIVVGSSPPDDADVHAATTTVPVGTATAARPTVAGRSTGNPRWQTGSLADVAADSGCSGLGRALADRVVGTAFPPGPTEQALRAEGEPAELANDRYATAARAVGVGHDGFEDEVPARQRNERLASDLATRFATICRGGYDSPEAAAQRAAPGTVLVSVRTWSP